MNVYKSSGLICVLLIALLLLMGCAPAGQAGFTAAPLQPVSFLRTRVLYPDDQIQITIAPDGSYLIRRHGGGYASSSTPGQLTADQRARLIAAFDGWDKLDTVYATPGGVYEEFQFEIKYGGKTVVASDAAPNFPAAIRKVYAELKAIVLAAGIL